MAIRDWPGQPPDSLFFRLPPKPADGSLFLSGLGFPGCNVSDPKDVNEQEVFTTVRLQYANVADSKDRTEATIRFKEGFGHGGDVLEKNGTIPWKADATYSVELGLPSPLHVDDHLRNHGFLHEGRGFWRLSPAFDINPSPERARESKTWVSEDAGPDMTLGALMSVAAYFRIAPARAKEILRQVARAANGWRKTGRAIGMTDKELDAFTDAFEHPERAAAEKKNLNLGASFKAGRFKVHFSGLGPFPWPECGRSQKESGQRRAPWIKARISRRTLRVL